MNRDQLAGKWKQLRGQVKAKWGKLTDDELDQIAGNFDMLVGKIQEKYGKGREEIERELETLTVEEPVKTGSAGPGEPARETRPTVTGQPTHKSR